MKVTFKDIQEAQKILSQIIRHTEIDYSESASKILGQDIYFKYENTQRTGSFKLRGAYNKINHLSNEEKTRGVVASSAGNHAQGVALSAKLASVRSTIVMPETAPLNKVEATRGYGANVVLKGAIYDEAYEYARCLEKEQGFTFVHPYEDPHVIAGQGTLGVEILTDQPNIENIIVPIGGGGLISGVAIAAKHINPKIKIIGVQSTQAPSMSQLFHKQDVVYQQKAISTIADGIAVKKPSAVMYENFISQYVDDIVTVNDDEIAHAIVFLLERSKSVCEGSGASGFAALLSGKIKVSGQTCVLLSGGNIDLNTVAKVIERGQIERGRLVELSVVVDDTPGNLNRLTKLLAEAKANILQVHHDRISQGLYLREARIDLVLETINQEHIEKIKKQITEIGIKIL